MALSRWARAHGKTEPPAPIVPPESAPEIEQQVDEDRELLDRGPATLEDQETADWVDEMRQRNPRAFHFG